MFGEAEKDLVDKLLHEDKPYGTYPDTLAFMVTPELDVFSNIGEPMPWWRLGNLKSDNIDKIMHCLKMMRLLGYMLTSMCLYHN